MSVKCQCEACQPNNPGPTYTQSYRDACFLRYAQALPEWRLHRFMRDMAPRLRKLIMDNQPIPDVDLFEGVP